ncbi:MAG: CPBP family intramembrane metalloprotease [Myxococcales bacterium]|nr:CPBP family intramembrane metalloprotease [Myxococcales bacterium]
MERAAASFVRGLARRPEVTLDGRTPRPRAWAFFAIVAFLGLQAWARYRWRVGWSEAWFGVHLTVAYAVAIGILALAHGSAFVRGWSRQTWSVLGIGALCLCGWWYTGRIDSWRRWFGGVADPGLPLAPLWPFLYFAAMGAFWRLAVPFAVLGPAFGLRPRHLGLWPPGGRGHSCAYAVVYAGLFAAVLPFVIYAAGAPAFLERYPLARDILRPDGTVLAWQFALYQVAYIGVFVAGESFWRGLLTFGVAKDVGVYGIALMLVPYVTAHYGKPLPETLGALVAGSVLGWLALHHRSVWLGVALHYAVALTMDVAALRGLGVRLIAQ